ncbi:hypothetical protein C361_03550 [Cryptococcus neoformans Tu259-1]|uniref:Uncharacterized protein n=1 Tax=Cryptococcus neoformans Tu259-1 TaxID=1230072 RepID=A0A854QEE5_CRYNE|nr:hypothetical protein C353_03250 [Cryptococcus neoformans var. grubii AD1-83a]OWZ54658.1 hypothetical protein C368_03302 [Cryptococcus neoformans var. grubii 125.91]OXG21332.1 hypothetical protein C361_03550 [Cryptococcus neoformans var. grubii Tu259-1]OXG59683.1 hypothetical protein C354_03186 [Cryptococcus neoformans var. grubii MW-RSA1955]OXG63868.1 hypothetical protein C351_02976 [Cryptococcus neoformans var. grubii c8]OXG64761.1 hypothetical protein C352_03195 [Cryptococcus neoformans v
MFISMLTSIVAAGRTKVHPRVVWGARWHRDGDGGQVRGRLKRVRHERKGVSVGIGGSKGVVDGGLVMEWRIDKVLGNLIRWSADSRPVWRTHKRNIIQLRPFSPPYGHPSPMLCVPGISKFFGPFEGLNAVQLLISESSEALLKIVVEIFRVFEFVLPSTSVECDPGAVNEFGNFQLFRLSAESFDP